MRRVNFNHVESRFYRPRGSSSKCLNDPLYSVCCQCFGRWVILGERYCTWSPDIVGPSTLFRIIKCRSWLRMDPRGEGRCFSACVSELDPEFLGLGMRVFGEVGEWFDVVIRPNAYILRADTCLRKYCGCFEKGKGRTSGDDATDSKRTVNVRLS